MNDFQVSNYENYLLGYLICVLSHLDNIILGNEISPCYWQFPRTLSVCVNSAGFKDKYLHYKLFVKSPDLHFLGMGCYMALRTTRGHH
jgi:hypothetical protein